MAEVLAGLVCGYALALAVTPVAAVALVRARPGSAAIERMMPLGSSLIAVSIILHTFAFLVLTALGMLLGLLLGGLEGGSPDGGLGSPNLVFTAFVIAAVVIAVGPMAVALPRLRLSLLLGGLIFAGVFGWAMPYLSLLGPEGG